MKIAIIEQLQKVAARHRTRFIKKNPDMLHWLETTYPAVPLNIIIDALVRDISPYCSQCTNAVKSIGKQTCSVACRSKESAIHKDKILAKRKQTMLAKFGVENPAQLVEVQNRRAATCMEKYGAAVSPATAVAAKSRAHELNVKGRHTLYQKYGVHNPGQLLDHRAKTKKTLLKNYGVDNYFDSDEFKKIAMDKRTNKWLCIFPPEIVLLNINSNLQKQELFDNPNLELEINCTTCGTYDKIPTETAKWRMYHTGTPCRNCSGINQGSLKQISLLNFIQSIGIDTISNFKLSNNKEIDVFCPHENIGFEFNGLYWHNDQRINKKYHADKTATAAAQGITLIHIFEDEWDHKQDIVKSRISNLLGFNKRKIGARQCTLQLVSSNTEKEFIELNHIQGYAKSSVAVGLYFNDELVSMMTFSKPSRAKGQQLIEGHWELLRFCSVLNTTITGAAGKLFNYFVKIKTPLQVLSFADSRWSTGKLYETLDFARHTNTALNYWYIDLKAGKRIYRYSLRKNKDDDQSLTEYQNRQNQGYLRIWDCGSSKWIWTPK